MENIVEDVEDVNVSQVSSVTISQIVNEWLQKFDKNDLMELHFREHWRNWVPKGFLLNKNLNSLNWCIKEDIVKEHLIAPLEEFICCGKQETILYSTTNLDNKSSVCGKYFKNGEATYNCRDCCTDKTCVLCIDCFKLSAHKHHRYRMSTSAGNGCCDCGDIEAWKNDPHCELHAEGLNNSKKNSQFSKDLLNRLHLVFVSVLRFIVQVLTLNDSQGFPSDLIPKKQYFRDDQLESEENDFYSVILYNDETHTYEQVISCITQVIKCPRHEAIEIAVKIDREGRAVIKTSTFIDCLDLKAEILYSLDNVNQPLKVSVDHTYIITHQMFALKLLKWITYILLIFEQFRSIFSEVLTDRKYSTSGHDTLLEGILLSDSVLWKSARRHCHRLIISGMFMEYESKKTFAKIFTRNYEAIQKDFFHDDQCHYYSVASLSTQIFPVPTIAHYLIAHENILVVLIDMFITSSMKKHNVLKNNSFLFQSAHFKKVVFILQDLKYLLGNVPLQWNDELQIGFLNGFNLLLDLLKNMEGIEPVKRQINQHVESEPIWQLAYNFHAKIASVVTLVFKWCSSDKNILIKAYSLTLNKLFGMPTFDTDQSDVVWELVGHYASCLNYDVSQKSVSFHLQLTRFFAGLHLYLENYNLTFDSPCFFSVIRPSPVQLIEPSLRVHVLRAQIYAGMWRLNGRSMLKQISAYHSVRFRGEMFDKDVIMLQIGASLIESNQFCMHLINKYGLNKWISEEFETEYENDLDDEELNKIMIMVDEFLLLLITIISERYMVGVGEVTEEDCIKNEIIHKLFIQPLPHSEIVQSLSKDMCNETSLKTLLNQVSDYKKHSTGKNMYEIKPEFLNKFHLYYYHYTKEEMSKAEEGQRKLRKTRFDCECCPPPLLPPFRNQFKMVSNLLQCDVMLHIIKKVLERSLNPSIRTYSESHLHKVLYLIGLALNEEQQKFSTLIQFTTNAENLGLEKILENVVKSVHIKVHKDFLIYTLKKYKEIIREPSSEGFSKNYAETSSNCDYIPDLQVKENRAKLAAEKRAKIMAQMAFQQQQFMRKNLDLFAENQFIDNANVEQTDMEIDNNTENYRGCFGPSRSKKNDCHKPTELICIICQENQIITSSSPVMVLAAFIQKSTVLCRSKNKSSSTINNININRIFELILDSNLGPAPHVSTCGHVMHSKCWFGYIDGILSKKLPHLIAQSNYFDVEYFCPLCYSLNNTVLPVIPFLEELSVNKQEEFFQEGDSFTSWYNTSLHAIKKEKFEDFPESTSCTKIHSASCSISGKAADLEESVVQNSKDSYSISSMTNSEELDNNQSNKLGNQTESKLCPLSNLISLKNSDILTKLRTFLGFREEEKCIMTENATKTQSKVPMELLQIVELFARMAYNKGLDLDEYKDNFVIPMITWKCCAYTIRTTECLWRFKNKPILGDFTPREQNGLENLMKLSNLLLVLFNDKHVANEIGVRLLTMLIANQEEDPSLLDWDSFGLLVPLTAVLPLVFYPEDFLSKSRDLSLDLHLIQLLLLVNMAQSILDVDESQLTEPNQVDDYDTACLQDLVKILRNFTCVNTATLWNHLKKESLSFLRSAVIFYHFQTGTTPTLELRTQGGDTYENLCYYLGLPTSCKPLLGLSCISALYKTWAAHPKLKQLSNNGHTIKYFDMNPLNDLIKLPDDYSELLNSVSLFKCPNSCSDNSNNPSICLICGELICSEAYCCQRQFNDNLVGASTYHSYNCGGGVGIFLRVADCEILLLSCPYKGCFLESPYVDEYDETDQHLSRGDPLHLSQEHYRHLKLLWLSHLIPETIARSLEHKKYMSSIQWQNL